MSRKVLVVDDKQMMRDSVAATLQRAGYTIVAAPDGQAALRQVQKHRPMCVVTDLKMPGMTGIELLGKLRQIDDQLPVVLMTAFGTIGEAVEAMKLGAFDFIQKPFEGDQLVLTVNRAVKHGELVKENAQLKANVRMVETPALIGQSQAMRHVLQQIRQIAHTSGTVLIAGESGTGKEVVARTIHAFSLRSDRVMLCLNFAALSSSLLESELFGHEKGAFTGADQLRKGRFELADGGTLLLDEISEIGPELQAKLLRVLQEGQFERVGSSVTMSVDARVIATTNRDLTRSVMAGEFRQDLYYRLNVLPIVLPPLRERVEDIPILADHFLAQAGQRDGEHRKKLSDEAAEVLQRYPWPGNVRELQNICERASVLCVGPTIKASLLQPWLIAPMPAFAHPAGGFGSGTGLGNAMGAGGGGGGVGGGPRPQLPAGGEQAYGQPVANPMVSSNMMQPSAHQPGTHQSNMHQPNMSQPNMSQPMPQSGMPQPPVSQPMPPQFGMGQPDHVGFAGGGGCGGGGQAVAEPQLGAGAQAQTDEVKTLEDLEREQILLTLQRFGGNRARSAEALGIGLRTLGLKLKKWKEQQLIAQDV